MKLQRFKADQLPKPVRGVDVLAQEPSTQPLELDPRKLVDPHIWDRISWYLKRVAEWRPSEEMPLLRLCINHPELLRKLEAQTELWRDIQNSIYNQAGHEVEKDIYVNETLARYVGLFPGVLQDLDDTMFPFPHDFQKSLDSFDDHRYIDSDLALLTPRAKALLQLFPEKKDVILDKLKRLGFWEKGMEEARSLSQLPGQAFDDLPAILADLAIIFPDRIDEILNLTRPHWSKLQERMVSWGAALDLELDEADPMERPRVSSVTKYVDNILGMQKLSELSKKKISRMAQPLPDRLTA